MRHTQDAPQNLHPIFENSVTPRAKPKRLSRNEYRILLDQAPTVLWRADTTHSQPLNEAVNQRPYLVMRQELADKTVLGWLRVLENCVKKPTIQVLPIGRAARVTRLKLEGDVNF